MNIRFTNFDSTDGASMHQTKALGVLANHRAEILARAKPTAWMISSERSRIISKRKR